MPPPLPSTSPTGPERRPWGRLLLLSLALFVAANAMPALAMKDSSQGPVSMYGLELLLFGWYSLKFPQVAWLANVFLLLGWVFTLARMRWLAQPLAVLALGAALTTFLLSPQDTFSNINTRTTFVGFLPGCFVWLASVAAAVVAALLVRPWPKVSAPA